MEDSLKQSDACVISNVSSLSVNSDYSDEKWEKPPRCFFKINFDAAVHPDGSGDIGCVIRDSRGYCLGAATRRIFSSLSVDQLEGMAVVQGAVFARNIYCNKVILEGDSSKVCNFYNSKQVDRSVFGSILANLHSLGNCFNSFHVLWKRRKCNNAPHEVAKLSFSCTYSILKVYWFDDLPSPLVAALTSDAN